MDLRQFHDLYLSETQEHLRLLNRSLLALERDEGGAALAEAFRAAHTIKGMAAAMGHGAVAGLAHDLEDHLGRFRDAAGAPLPEAVDALLTEADALEAAMLAVTEPAAPDLDSDGWTDAPRVAPTAAHMVPVRPTGPVPAGTALIARVRLAADAPIKAARAMLITRSLASRPDVLGSEPFEFDDDFPGVFHVFLAAGADQDSLTAAIMAAGDVDTVEIETPVGGGTAPTTVGTAGSAPVRQLRVDARRVDGLAEGIAELSVLCARFSTEAPDAAAVPDLVDRMAGMVSALQHEILALRMVPVRDVFDRLHRAVRDAARTLKKDVDLIVSGDDVELDRSILDEIGEPLIHLLRNAVDHGIEPADERLAAGKPVRGSIRLSAARERGSVLITVSDDGSGVDAVRLVSRARAAGVVVDREADELTGDDVLRLLSTPGLSTAEQVSEVSGRGVGMDVVVNRIRALGGAIGMRSDAGAGTTFDIRLPITLAVAQVLRVRIGNEDYGIPLTHVTEAVELDAADADADAQTVVVRDERIPLVRMRRRLGVQGRGAEHAAVITEMSGRRTALAVDELIGREQIMVKSFDAAAGTLPYFSGAMLLADGRPALVLDPLSVI